MKGNEMSVDNDVHEIGRDCCRIASRTKPYLINLHCQSLPFRIGCKLTSRLSDFIGNEFSKVVFDFLIFFTFGKELRKKNKIDVLSEEPCPLRRGGATGRANRLMMYDDKER